MTKLYLGEQEVKKMYLGSKEIKRIYKGDTLAFECESISVIKPIVYLPFDSRSDVGFTDDFGNNTGAGYFINKSPKPQNDFSIGTTDPFRGAGQGWSSGHSPDRPALGTSTGIPELNLGTNDFTIECWVSIYLDAVTDNYPYIVCPYINPVDGSNTFYLQARNTGFGNEMYMAYLGALGVILQHNIWTHIAVIRKGTNLSVYIDGIKIKESDSVTGNINLSNMCVAGSEDGLSAFRGNIDDFAIWDYAKYTENFTPPTEPVYTPTVGDILRIQARELKIKK